MTLAVHCTCHVGIAGQPCPIHRDRPLSPPAHETTGSADRPRDGEILLLEQAERRLAEAQAAIRWALGEEGEFPEEPPPLAGKYRQRYHWRRELRRRAGSVLPGAALLARARV